MPSLKTLIILILGFAAVSTSPALAADGLADWGADSLNKMFVEPAAATATKTATQSPFGRLVAAKAAQQAATATHVAAVNAELAAKAALAPVAERLAGLKASLKALPAGVEVARVREALEGAIAQTEKQVGPLEADACKKAKAAKAAEKELAEATKKVISASIDSTAAIMQIVSRQVEAAAGQVATGQAKLDAANAVIAEFCSRNPPTTSICTTDAGKAAIAGAATKLVEK